MDALIQRLPSPLIAIPLLVLIASSLYNRLTALSKVPEGVPWVGKDPSKFFAGTRAFLASFTGVREWLASGYDKFGKNNMSYILPDTSGSPEVILPRSQMAWLIDQPDNTLSTSAAHYDSLEGDYAFTDPQILKDPYHEHVIHKYLPRRVAALLPETWEEVQVAMDQTWGMNTETWKEIEVGENMMRIIPSITNRMMIGLPICRNEDFLKNMSQFAMDVITSASLYLKLTPRFLKPLVGPLVTIPNTRHWRNTTKYTLPIINERLANFKKKQEDPSFQWNEPNDYISWHINLATAEGRHDELTPDMISRRLMPVNFAAIHTTALTITNTILDLVSSPSSPQWLDSIREEAEKALAEEGGKWTKASLARCHLSDSAIRESMRVSNFMTRNVVRKVMPEAGIENKVEGWRAPKGALISIDMHSVHHDPSIYSDPNTYDPFRFSRPKEEEEEEAGDVSKKEIKNTGLITTSDIFLSFSHGRHACPGRFFVSMEMKLLLAYMVMNYEIQPLESRPPNSWIGSSSVPPMKARVKVRRK